jgi:hypothetical protein
MLHVTYCTLPNHDPVSTVNVDRVDPSSSTISNSTSKSFQSSYSIAPINRFRTFMFTTPPTPKAGTILHIRAAALLAQSRNTFALRSPLLAPGRLYRSSPSKCSGVLTSCTAAGVINCAALALLTYRLTPSLMCASKLGASSGGRLKLAKMVRQSRTVKRANVGRGTGRADPAEPKSWVNLLSL